MTKAETPGASISNFERIKICLNTNYRQRFGFIFELDLYKGEDGCELEFDDKKERIF